MSNEINEINNEETVEESPSLIWDNTEEINIENNNESDEDESEEEVIEDESDENTSEDEIVEDETDEVEDENDEVEEDELIKNSFEVFKDTIFKELPDDYEFKATEKGFEEAIGKVKENVFKEVHNEYLGRLNNNPKAQEYLEFLVKTEGKGNIDKWIEINLHNNFSEKDLEEDEELQKQVLTEYYKSTGIPEDYIEEKIIDLEDFGKLEKESKLALEYINRNKKNSNDKLVEDTLNEEENKRKQYETNYSILSEVVKSNNIPDTRQEQIINEILNPVKLENGKETTLLDYRLALIKNNPNHVIELANLLLNYDPEKGLNLNKFVDAKINTKKTKNIKEKLEQVLNSNTITSSKSSSYRKKNKNVDLSNASFVIN